MSEKLAINRGRGKTWKGTEAERSRWAAIAARIGRYILLMTGVSLLGSGVRIFRAIVRRIDTMLRSRGLSLDDLDDNELKEIADEAISKE